MNTKLKEKLDLLLENYARVKTAYPAQSPMIRCMAALLYTAEDRPLEGAAIKQSRERIKASTGIFSGFRGNMTVVLAAMLSLSPDPDLQLERTLDVHGRMKKAGFKSSDYLILAAYTLAQSGAPEEYDRLVGRAAALYEGMKKQHPALTGKDDYIFTAMLAAADLEVDTALTRMEEIFQALGSGLFGKNRIQALSQVLVLSGETSAAIARVESLRDACSQRSCRLDQEYTMPLLGTLALLPGTVETTAEDLAETREYLRGQKGFGGLSINKQELTMVAAALVAYAEADEAKSGAVSSALGTGITSILIAQQAAMLAAMTAITATTVNSSSSN